jgi:hypothetical protein
MKFILLILLSWAGGALAQQSPEHWVKFVSSVDGGSLFYRSDIIKRFDYPPALVSTMVYEQAPGKKTYSSNWELHCGSKELRIESNKPMSIAHQKNTISRFLFEGLCGVRNENGYWFGLGVDAGGTIFAINADTL